MVENRRVRRYLNGMSSRRKSCRRDTAGRYHQYVPLAKKPAIAGALTRFFRLIIHQVVA